MLKNWNFKTRTPGGGKYYLHKTLLRGCTVYPNKIIFWYFKGNEPEYLPFNSYKHKTKMFK